MNLHKLLFYYYPYIAILTFIFGSIYRYEYNQYSWKTSSSQILEKNLLYWGSNLFHFGIIFLLTGHFFGLLTPHKLYVIFISAEKKQIVAMISGGIAGTASLVGITILIYRRLKIERVKSTTTNLDMLVLILLKIQLILGLMSIFISYSHLPKVTSMLALANWSQGIFLLSKNLHLYVMYEHWIFKAHIFIGLTIMLITPFTRLVHIFSIPYLYILREGYQIVRSLK